MVNRQDVAIGETKRLVQGSGDKIPIVSGWKDTVVSPHSEQTSGDRLFCDVMPQYVCVAASYIFKKFTVCFLNESGEIWEVRRQVSTASHLCDQTLKALAVWKILRCKVLSLHKGGGAGLIILVIIYSFSRQKAKHRAPVRLQVLCLVTEVVKRCMS